MRTIFAYKRGWVVKFARLTKSCIRAITATKTNKVTSSNGDLGVFIRRRLSGRNVHIKCTTQNEADQTTLENYKRLEF